MVTSTSTDCLLPLQAEGEGEEVSIDLDAAVLTSPARITSSTNNYDILNYSSTDSLSLEEDMVMPTTSENAARIEREETSSSSHKLIHRSVGNSSRATKSSSAINEMVARDTTHTTVADAAEDDGGAGDGGNVPDISLRNLNDQAASTSTNSECHKIILKLPKTSAGCESQALAEGEDDPRKVEPLKINLHNTHHHHNTHHTPKITIKPILKESTTDASLVSSEECSSSAEDDIVSQLNNSEPHIVPKLTIRAKNEDYGSSLTTVVPKLTIKINDPTTSEGPSKSTAALNTPPLPKLTIKTGQDGHTESIITNVSPASSTTSSSSSLASSSATSLSSANSVMAPSASTTSVPKLTIKPLHKSQDFLEQQLPSIPKLCIKTNTLTTDVSEEPTASKIPKLTIKTGQEHAVIITQHNDNAKNSGGIPKMTIKTKSLDMVDDANAVESCVGDKIPKLTIKTNNPLNESIPKLCINKAQLEASSSSIGPSLSPKQPVVPKLTISRQSVQAERVVDMGEAANASSVPKMTIKTQSNKTECVPKLTLKSVTKRPSSTEESGISDDPEDERIAIVETNKTVPKLTIKNVGSPQQKLKIVVEDVKGDISRKTNPIPPNPICEDVALLNTNEDVDDFNDLLNVDNAGEESSNSQEFCGFNENLFVEKQNMVEESRRQSDDMDIDESLQSQHEPQIFQNAVHFEEQGMPVSSSQAATELNGNTALNAFPKLAHIIDTVDLTSSAGSSPAHRFEYNEEDDEVEGANEQRLECANKKVSPQSNILLERLQRETSVIQNTQNVIMHPETNSIPPPLQPKPPLLLNNNSNASARYPELMERLMTNGSLPVNMNTVDYSQTSAAAPNTEENIIDSIEILDTPEGSPRVSLDDRPEQVKSVPEKPVLPNGLHYPKELLTALNNNNSNLKRHATQMISNSLVEGLHNLAPTETNLEELPSKLRKLQNDTNELNQMKVLESNVDEQQCRKSAIAENVIQPSINNHQRSRKQKHEHLLPLPIDEVVDSMQSNNSLLLLEMGNDNRAIISKRKSVRGRKSEVVSTSNAKEESSTTPAAAAATPIAADNKSRRVQLLRKRLAIDMVDAEQPLSVMDNIGGMEESAVEANKNNHVDELIETPRREQRSLRTPLRTSRRSNTPTTFQIESKQTTKSNKPPPAVSYLAMENNKKGPKHEGGAAGVRTENVLNHFLESNSSVSSASSTQSATITATMAGSGGISNSGCLSMATQIDLTMSSSSSNSNGSTTNTVTTVESTTISRLGGTNGSGIVNITGGGSSNNSMLPPTTILSSSDPLQDVVFRPNDFSSIIATQQLRGTMVTSNTMSQPNLDQSLEEEGQDEASGADYSEGKK